MTAGRTGAAHWRQVDQGWGRRAADFATLSEPANVREYTTVHHRIGVDTGDRLIDIACGSGFAIELARIRGADCSGIDAAHRLVAIARDRNPYSDIRVGDMNALPWGDASFDVATSFRGIWGTTPVALGEIRRVLVPGGRLGLTVWGHVKASTGRWALAPLRLAATDKLEHQAAMQLGRPGVGEVFLRHHGFTDVQRTEVPFAWEFADPEIFARTIASTGPAYEAIQHVGETAFLSAAVDEANVQMRQGLPLRAEISVVCFSARTPG